jgi:hypothetical protein
MFTVDDDTAGAIRRVYEESGELAAVVELRRRFPLLESSEHASSCVRLIASWRPIPVKPGKSSSAGRLSGKKTS